MQCLKVASREPGVARAGMPAAWGSCSVALQVCGAYGPLGMWCGGVAGMGTV